MVSTPAMAHKDPTIFPHTPTGLQKIINERFNSVSCKFRLILQILFLPGGVLFIRDVKGIKNEMK